MADNELCFSPARCMEEEEVTDADVTINFSSLDVAVDELVCFSPARCIERGSGQNKNNTVLKLVMWLKEMRYFKRVSFVFLIVGHTKNACDCLFKSLKHEYRKKNIFTMDGRVDCCFGCISEGNCRSDSRQ